MNEGDEQLLRGRVYGYDHGGPNPGPLPHRTYATLVAGPLDGLLVDITGWRPEEIEDGVALMTELGRWPGGCALYDPLPGEPLPPGGPGVVCRFHYTGDTPRLRCLRSRPCPAGAARWTRGRGGGR